MKPLFNLLFTPNEWGSPARVAMTLSCRDTDRLPKVPQAGETLEHGGHRVQVMHNGLRIHEGCYYGDWTTDIIRGLRGHHEPQEEVCFHEVLAMLAGASESTSPLIVELGSFWAYYSMWFLHAFPQGKAVCLEPDPRYLEVGRRNFSLNGMKGEFVWGGIGDGGEAFEFTPESDQFALDDPLGTLQCPQFSLAQLAGRAARERIDLLLADIQGAELHLLRTNRDFFVEGRVKYGLFSTHHREISGSYTTHQDVLKVVEECGGQVLCEHSVSESFSGDGLVCAAFGQDLPVWDVDVSRARARESQFGEVESWAEAERLKLVAANRELRVNQARQELLQARLGAARQQTVAAELERDQIRAELSATQVQLSATQVQLSATQAQLSAMQASRSWRMTKPLRAIRSKD